MKIPSKIKIHAYPVGGVLAFPILEHRGEMWIPEFSREPANKRKMKKAFNRWHKIQHSYEWVEPTGVPLGENQAYRRNILIGANFE